MSKIFRVSPSGLATSGVSAQDPSPSTPSSSSLSTIDDSSPNTPITPLSPTQGLSPFTTLHTPTTAPSNPTSTKKNQEQKNKRLSTEPSKVLLSFFLSPAGYNLLHFDQRKSKMVTNRNKNSKEKKEDVSTKDSQDKHDGNNNTTMGSTKKGARSLTANRSKRRIQGSFIDPEEYHQWFKTEVLSPSDSSHPLLSSHPGDLSSATRSAIRGFILAFIAGSILDVLFPAVLKQKFKGLGHRLFFGNQSSVALGASAGGFAFCYKILFRHITLFFDRVTKSFPYEQLKSSMRIDSGVDLDLDGEQVQGQEENANGIIESKLSSRKWVPAALAALLASPAFALIPGQARRLTMAMYFLTYAGEVTYSALEFKGLTQWLPSWFGIWLLFPISAGQTIHTFFHHGDCFPLAFRKVIMSQSNPYLVRPRGYDAKTLGPYPEGEHVFIALSNYARARAYNAHLPASAIQPELSDTATAVSSLATVAATAGSFLVPSSTESVLRHTEGMGHHSALCRFFHPNTPSCSAAAMTLAGRYMKFALKLYGTLAVLAFLAKGGNVVKHGYLNYFKRSGIATVKSAVSTWGMMVTSFSLLCTMDRYLPATFMPTKRLYLNGFLGGLWILVESPQRQSALTLYYTRFMLEGLWRRLVKAGWATNFKNGETLIFGLAMAVIMGIFESLPKMQRKSMIQGALTKIFVD